MKLTDLEPEFLKVVEPGKTHQRVDTLAEAQGIFFLCLKCFEANGSRVGTHGVICWFAGRGVLDTEVPGPGRWEAVGTGYADLTLRASSSSILLTGGCAWHGYVQNGDVVHCR